MQEKTNKRKIFRERASQSFEGNLSRLKEAESLKVSRMDRISSQERESIFELEGDLHEKLEAITDKEAKVFNFYPGLLKIFDKLSPRAQEAIEFLVGRKGEKVSAEDGVSFHDLVKRRDAWQKAGESHLSPEEAFGILEGEMEDVLYGFILGDQRYLDETTATDICERFKIIKNPDDLINKEKELRELRSYLTKEKRTLDPTSYDDKIKKVIFDVYLRKVNELIAKQASSLQVLAEERDFNKPDKKSGATKRKRKISRYDKFLQGASNSEKYENGDYKQIGDALSKLADKAEEDYLTNELNKHKSIKEKGLSQEKINSRKLAPQLIKELVGEALRKLGLTSLESDDDGDHGQNDGWAVKIIEGRKSAMVSREKREILLSDKGKVVTGVVPVLLGHEIFHVCQYENGRRLSGLKIVRKNGLDRKNVLFEGGAMDYENQIRQEIFGYKTVPNPFYIRAMERKQEGGSYLECVEAFFASASKIIDQKEKSGIINNAEAEEEKKSKLKLAINRTKRLFLKDRDLSESDNLLTNSLASNYIEQQQISEKMKEEGLGKYLCIGGINLEVLPEMIEAGLINKNIEMINPGNTAQEIWEDKLKADYLV